MVPTVVQYRQHSRVGLHKSHPATVAGQYYCSGSCYPVNCQALAALKAGKPPVIRLSTQAKSMLGSSLKLVSAYATPVPFNLMPCLSSGIPFVSSVLSGCPTTALMLTPTAHIAGLSQASRSSAQLALCLSEIFVCQSCPCKASVLLIPCDYTPCMLRWNMQFQDVGYSHWTHAGRMFQHVNRWHM